MFLVIEDSLFHSPTAPLAKDNPTDSDVNLILTYKGQGTLAYWFLYLIEWMFVSVLA